MRWGGGGGGVVTDELERAPALGMVRVLEEGEDGGVSSACAPYQASVLCACLSVYACGNVAVMCYAGRPAQTSSATRSRLLHDKVTYWRLRATSAVIHLCQEKTGIKKRGTEAR